MIEPLSKLLSHASTPRGSALNRVSERGVLILVGIVALMTAGLLMWLAGSPAIAAGFSALVMATAALILFVRKLYPPLISAQHDFDWALVRDAADNDDVAIAVTDRAGRLVCANLLHESWFGGPVAPPALALGPSDVTILTLAGKTAWRDGRGQAKGLRRDAMVFDADVVRSGRSENHLVWRFRAALTFDLTTEARRLIEGTAGDRMGEAGIMTVLIGPEGRIRMANPVFVMRSLGSIDHEIEGREFVTLLETAPCEDCIPSAPAAREVYNDVAHVSRTYFCAHFTPPPGRRRNE